MNEMNKTIIEQYEKDGYESAKKSFMDFVNADRSEDKKDDVILSYITMAKLAFVNKDNEMTEKLLRLDSKFAKSSEKSQLDNSANVINILGIKFVELYPYVYVSRKTISDADLKRIGAHSNYSIGSWNEATHFCRIMSGRNPYYKFRLPTEKEFLDIIKCHKEKGIQLEPPSVYELTSARVGKRGGYSDYGIYSVTYNSQSSRVDLEIYKGGAVNTAFRVIMELKR